MDSSFKLLPIALLLCFSLSNISTARILDSKSKATLAARLKLDEADHGSSSNCWESLFQLQSCTTEIMLFFLNGEAYLGPGCCAAIRIIQKDCWPDLLGSLGYTTKEGDILEGYCDASEGGSGVVPTPPAPPQLDSKSKATLAARILDSKSKATLAARLKLGEADQGSSSNCWESLFQLQSCTTEIVLFFLNGETYLGPGCCGAIRTIQKDCWPDLLGSLGYTTKEGDVLEGYCDASEGGSGAVPTPPAPPQLAH